MLPTDVVQRAHIHPESGDHISEDKAGTELLGVVVLKESDMEVGQPPLLRPL